MSSHHSRGAPYIILALIWFTAAVLLGWSGRIEQLRPPAPQLVIAALTALLLVAGARSTAFNQWLRSIPLPWIIRFHLTRLVGIGFIILASRHELPDTFALPAGWGDIAVAITALALTGYGVTTPRGRAWASVWNFAGLVDILVVVLLATSHAAASPASMAALLRFPWSLVPTFLVPLIIASHGLIYWRLKLDRETPAVQSEHR